jgi:NAD(P)-dependent dehydrogenase (short-subunit alcohol dehydrogenase family)
MNILITGGGSGIGAAIALELDKESHSVIICGRREFNLKNIAEKSNSIKFKTCDISNEKEVILFKEYVKKIFSYVDVILNCAGLQGAIGRFDKTDSKLWKKTFEINTFGTYLISKYFLQLLLNSKIKRIINFSGGGAFNAFPNYSAYAASKAAVVRLTETIAEELVEEGVSVNCIAPGFVTTEIHNATLSAGKSQAGKNYAFTMQKLNEGSVPIDVVVNCIKFLISDDAIGLTGKTISASFDKWGKKEFHSSIELINNSDLFTMRRINLVNLESNNSLRKTL